MPSREKRPTPDDMLRAEKEIGENIPDEMVGLDDGDVRPEAGNGHVEPEEPVEVVEVDGDEAEPRSRH